MFRKTTLQNELRIVTQKIEGTQAATVLVLVGAGSRYETKQQNGISHFLEHMFFKGAKRYVTAKAVSEKIDSIGGDFNAFTGKEYAGYYVKAAASHIDIVMDVLSDMLIYARFDQSESDYAGIQYVPGYTYVSGGVGFRASFVWRSAYGMGSGWH